jgi:hypothetical protein
MHQNWTLKLYTLPLRHTQLFDKFSIDNSYILSVTGSSIFVKSQRNAPHHVTLSRIIGYIYSSFKDLVSSQKDYIAQIQV